MSYLLHILILINIYLILSLSLNLIVGYAGMLSLSHAAFYGIGAYSNALLMVRLDVGFPLALLIAVVMTMLLSFTISAPSLRLKGDYLILASLGFQVIVYVVLYNWTGLTRGPYGITQIPSPKIFGFSIDTVGAYFIFTALIACACGWLMHMLVASPFGRVVKAIREDELAAASLGKNVVRFKITIFAIAAGFAAIAGALFAGYARYIDPTSFSLTESIFILSMVIIGGSGSFAGPIVGTILIVVLPEALRFLYIPDVVAGQVRQIIYGVLIILMVRYRPSGLLGRYEFR